LVSVVIVRCTAKLRALIGRQAQERTDPGCSPSDWYANLLVIERRKCLLVTHARTLFSVFAPDVRAAQLRPLGPFVVASVPSRPAPRYLSVGATFLNSIPELTVRCAIGEDGQI